MNSFINLPKAGSATEDAVVSWSSATNTASAMQVFSIVFPISKSSRNAVRFGLNTIVVKG